MLWCDVAQNATVRCVEAFANCSLNSWNTVSNVCVVEANMSNGKDGNGRYNKRMAEEWV